MDPARIRRLESLIEASKVLNSTLDFDRLLELILDLAVSNLDAERGTIYLVDAQRHEIWSRVLKGDEPIEIRFGIGVGIPGQVAETGETINVRDIRADPRFFSDFDPHSGLQSRNMLCMPMRDRDGRIIGVFQIIDKRDTAFDREDEHFLAAFSDHASLAIETARLHQELVAKELMEQEVRFAAEIQQRLLPAGDIRIPGYAVSGSTRPSRSIGGDYFDVIRVSDTIHLFVLADVAGKGLPAALLVSTLHGSLRAYVQAGIGLAELAPRLNRMLYDNTPAERYATAFIGELDLQGNTLRYLNAGHPAPLLLRQGQEQLLDSTAPPLGLLPQLGGETATIRLLPNDRLVAYSDGITEAVNASDEEFGYGRLSAVARACVDRQADETVRSILSEVRQFSGAQPQADDETVLVLHRMEADTNPAGV